jgi:hypothetical protein
MFNRLAGIHAARRTARALVHHNDNHPALRRAAASQSARAWRLACHWRLGAAGDRLESHWEIESADETEASGPGLSIMTAARWWFGQRTRNLVTHGRVWLIRLRDYLVRAAGLVRTASLVRDRRVAFGTSESFS